MIGFAEISMEDMLPWGGFGANPRPLHWQRYWEQVGGVLAGGFPYSEGIFEDINKAVTFQLNWSPNRTAADIVHEYAAYEYSPKVADDVLTACQLMEAGTAHRPANVPQYLATCKDLPPARASQVPLYLLPRACRPQRYLDLLERADAKLTPQARKAWRWRILLLRAQLDAELADSAGTPTAKSERCFRELTRIYHADGASWVVHPPTHAWLRDSYLRPHIE
jgi:hypothetical protein